MKDLFPWLSYLEIKLEGDSDYQLGMEFIGMLFIKFILYLSSEDIKATYMS